MMTKLSKMKNNEIEKIESKLETILETLREKHSTKWEEMKEKVFSLLDELRNVLHEEISLNENVNRFREKLGEVNKLLEKNLFYRPREKETKKLLESERFKIWRENLLDKEFEWNDDEVKKTSEDLDKLSKVVKNVNVSTLSTLMAVYRPERAIPISEAVLNRKLRTRLGIRRFWGGGSDSEDYVIFSKTTSNLTQKLGIKDLIETAFYLSKFEDESDTNAEPIENSQAPQKKENIDRRFQDIEKILKYKKQVILCGPPGTGKTYTALNYVRSREKEKIKTSEFVTFHPSYSYEEFVEGIKAVSQNGVLEYLVEDGIFKRTALKALCSAMKENDLKIDSVRKKSLWSEIERLERKTINEIFVNAPEFYLVIDEINRGDISKIFGELISLLDADKRLGENNQMIVTLPYSKEPFAIPPNFYIIGTMNTADRSIALIDAALRRRFGFVELMPEYKTLINTLLEEDENVESEEDAEKKIVAWNENNLNDIKKITIKAFWTLNKKIQLLYDRDHQIGHSYLLNLKDAEPENLIKAVKLVWYQEIIPLLQEYFYNDWEKLTELLGDFVGKDELRVKVNNNLRDEEKNLYVIKECDGEEFIETLRKFANN